MKLLSDELLRKDVPLKRLAHDKVVRIENAVFDTHHEPFTVFPARQVVWNAYK